MNVEQLNNEVIELTESMIERESFPESLANQSIQNGDDYRDFWHGVIFVIGSYIALIGIVVAVIALSGCTATISIQPLATESVDADQQAMSDDAMQWDRVEDSIIDNYGRKQ